MERPAGSRAIPQPSIAQWTGHPEFHGALLKALLDPTLAIDATGTIVLASASVERCLGWTPAELCGRNINVIMPSPHHEQHDDYLANYRRTGNTNILGRTREFAVLHKDGRTLEVELSVARAELPDLGPLFVGSLRDVSKRHAAERALAESERRFRAIFDSSYQYVGLLSPDGTLLEINKTALDLLGLERGLVVGKPFWETPWWLPADAGRIERAIAQAAGGTFVRFEAVHQTRDGELVTIDFSLNPIRDEQGRVVLLVPEGRNISELKRAQLAETSMLRTLATIGESSAMLAHEIKSPITAINVALRAVVKHLGADERAVLDDLIGRMQRLETLMRRTLSFAKALDLRPCTIEARPFLQGVLRELQQEILKGGADVRVEAEESVVFRGDAQLLGEVMINLLRNALEARPEGARIVLSALPTAQGETVIAVDDDGPGIAPSIKAALFKPFTTSKQNGTGLGLAFSRKVLEEHGGTIDVQDSALGGARFELRLPTVPPRR